MADTRLIKFMSVTEDKIRCGQFLFSPEWDEIKAQVREAEESDDVDEYSEMIEYIMEREPLYFPIYNEMANAQLAIENYGSAEELFSKTLTICNRIIPKKFKGIIPWDMENNRRFLEAIWGVSYCRLYMRKWQEAADSCAFSLLYNPNDNMGVRALLTECWLVLGQYDDVIKVSGEYERDLLPDTNYGVFLAYYRVGDIDNARAALKTAIECAPNVAKELVRKKHNTAFLDDSPFMQVGSKEEALDYWERTAHLWNDPGVLNFIRETLQNQKTS